MKIKKLLILILCSFSINNIAALRLINNTKPKNVMLKISNNNNNTIYWLKLFSGQSKKLPQNLPSNATLAFEVWDANSQYLSQANALNEGKKIIFDPKKNKVIYDKYTENDRVILDQPKEKTIKVSYEQNRERPSGKILGIKTTKEEAEYANVPASARGSVYEITPKNVSGEQNVYGKTPVMKSESMEK